MRRLRHSTRRQRKRWRHEHRTGRRYGRPFRRRRASGILAIIGLIVLALYILPDEPAQRAVASEEFTPSAESSGESSGESSQSGFAAQAGQDTHVFSGDFTVEAGERIEGDIVVSSGDLTIEEEGIVEGDVVARSGDINIERGGTVEGDIASFSGDVTIAGSVLGDIASFSGDVQLEESAYVVGDISVLFGDFDRENGATIEGSTVMGPNWEIMENFDFAPNFFDGVETFPMGRGAFSDNPESRDAPAPFGRRVGWFFLSLFGAAAFTFVAMLLTGIMATAWPQYVQKIEGISRKKLPLSFALGLLANVSLLLVSGILVLLLCTIPFALVLLLGMAAINIAGWTAISSAVGRRVTTQSQAALQPAVQVAIGALIVTAPVAFLAAFGGCFRFLAVLAGLLLVSAGAGAVVQDLLNQLSERNRRRQANGGGGRGTGYRGYSGDSGGPAGPAGSGGTPGLAQSVTYGSSYANPFADVNTDIDDFTRIQGIDEDADGRLLEAEIMTFAQLAALTPELLADILGWPVERVVNEKIIDRAEILAELS